MTACRYRKIRCVCAKICVPIITISHSPLPIITVPDKRHMLGNCISKHVIIIWIMIFSGIRNMQRTTESEKDKTFKLINSIITIGEQRPGSSMLCLPLDETSKGSLQPQQRHCKYEVQYTNLHIVLSFHE